MASPTRPRPRRGLRSRVVARSAARRELGRCSVERYFRAFNTTQLIVLVVVILAVSYAAPKLPVIGKHF